jgi:hypothetical protein
MYNTNEHVCVPVLKLVQHKVLLVEFRVGEACYGLSWWKLSVNPGYQHQWLFNYVDGTPGYTDQGLD